MTHTTEGKQMTDKLIERAKEALEKATPGPWERQGDTISEMLADDVRGNAVCGIDDVNDEDADLIVLAPDLASALIREREAADRLAEILDAAITEHDTANYDYGEENPWTMGEWFTDEDRAVLAAYRKAQKETDDDK